MAKKIAVVVRDRANEALRMAIGLTLADDTVDVFVLNQKLERTDDNALNIETIQDLELGLYSNVEDDPETAWMPTQELANKLLEYDVILPY
ncbi:MAG: hypothetical protein AMJ69_04700 [Gammaproteobacteria bacterium SG8_47]|nr:MAG: hypothetical protein AMJ69_04700 [Gammaproteobacteria bacterium SG8_47]